MSHRAPSHVAVLPTAPLCFCSQPWVDVLPRRVLMQQPHLENEAQRYHRLDLRKECLPTFDTQAVCELRILLRQPSPNWREIDLHDVECFGEAEDDQSANGADRPPSASPVLPLPMISDLLQDGASLTVVS
eukprot:EG_transcript_20999